MAKEQKTHLNNPNAQHVVHDSTGQRMDGWFNLLASMGGGKDRRSTTTYSAGSLLVEKDLEQLYRYNGFAKKIVDLPAYEMTREWVEIENDTENHGLQKLESLNAKQVLRDACKWGSLYGGALVVMGIDDGGLLEQPVNERGIRNVAWLRVYDRYQVTWTTADVNQNPESPYFGEPEYYTINAYTTGQSFVVHASRVLIHYGNDVPERVRVANMGWGDSVLQSVFEELRDYGIIKSSSVSIVQDFVQTLLQIENLAELISSGNEDIVKKRLELIDLSRSVNNTILLDKGEDFSKQASSVTGLSDLIGQFALALAGVTGIPVTKLFGQAPAGLNATGESDIRNFYDEISSKQEDILRPMLQKLHRYIMLARDGEYKGRVNAEAKICFVPLWQLSEKEDADVKNVIAKTDEIYIKNAVLSPAEVAVSRFDGGYNPDTNIDFTKRELEPEEDETEPGEQ